MPSTILQDRRHHGRAARRRASARHGACGGRFTRAPFRRVLAPTAERHGAVAPSGTLPTSRPIGFHHAYGYVEAGSRSAGVVGASLGVRSGGRAHRGRRGGRGRGRRRPTPTAACSGAGSTPRARPSRCACTRARTGRSTRPCSGTGSSAPSRTAASSACRAGAWSRDRRLPADPRGGDGLPGLIVDLFGDVVVVQLGTIGIKRREGVIFDALQAALSPRAIVDRTPESLAKLEGSPPTRAWCAAIPGSISSGSSSEGCATRSRSRSATRPGSTWTSGRCGPASSSSPTTGACSMRSASSARSPWRRPAAGRARSSRSTRARRRSRSGAECARENGLLDRIKFTRDDARKAPAERVEAGGLRSRHLRPPEARGHARARRTPRSRRTSASPPAACRATRPGGVLVLCSCSSAVSLDDLTRVLALGARDARMQAAVFDRHFQGGITPSPPPSPRGST